MFSFCMATFSSSSFFQSLNIFLNYFTIDLTGVIAIATARMTSSQTSCKDIGLSVPFFFWVFFLSFCFLFNFIFVCCRAQIEIGTDCWKFSFYDYMMGCCRHPVALYEIIDCPIFGIFKRAKEEKRLETWDVLCLESGTCVHGIWQKKGQYHHKNKGIAAKSKTWLERNEMSRP